MTLGSERRVALVTGVGRRIGIGAAVAERLAADGVDVAFAYWTPGWMSAELSAQVAARTPLGRIGQPGDVANLVSFLCSAEGGWVNGQLLMSNGGIAPR